MDEEITTVKIVPLTLKDNISPTLEIVIKVKPVFDSILKLKKSTFVPTGFCNWVSPKTIQNRLSVGLRWLCYNTWPPKSNLYLPTGDFGLTDYALLRRQIRIKRQANGVKLNFSDLLINFNMDTPEMVQYISLPEEHISITPIPVRTKKPTMGDDFVLDSLTDLKKQVQQYKQQGSEDAMLVIPFKKISEDVELFTLILTELCEYMDGLGLMHSVDEVKQEVYCIK